MSKKYLDGHVLFPMLLVVGLAFGLGACNPKPEETTLAFETLEQKEWAGIEHPYESLEPSLIVVSLPEEINKLSGFVGEESRAKLQALDYANHFALLVLQGLKPTTGYQVNVVRITRLKDTVSVYADFIEPKPDQAKADAVTSPYQLVQAQKVGAWDQKMLFNLIVENVIVASASASAP